MYLQRQRGQGLKYGNQKTLRDGVLFHSKKEANRYSQLKLLLRGNEITELTLQPKFCLIQSFVDNQGITHRPIYYIADFQYKDHGETIVEDVKGRKTKEYEIKKKLFLLFFPGYIFKET